MKHGIMDFLATPGKKLTLKDFPTSPTGTFKSKKEASKHLSKNIETMKELQSKLYAHNKYSVLLIFQAMDTAGKDGAIKHVMSGLNPQGTQVRSFKVPSDEELNHDYLWRSNKYLPERGNIGIFNRSYYEEVLVVKVHTLLQYQLIPNKLISEDIWEQRYRQIREYEQYLSENGTIVMKFFLHISPEEQLERFQARLLSSLPPVCDNTQCSCLFQWNGMHVSIDCLKVLVTTFARILQHRR